MKKTACALAAILCAAPLVFTGCEDGNGGGTGGKPDHSFTVCDSYAWLGDYPETEITPVFGDAENAQTVSFEYDTSKITITDYKAKALSEGEVEVRAYTPEYSTTFKLFCETPDTSGKEYKLNQGWTDWTARKEGFESRWAMEGNAGKTTLFIGDSFFDASYFWNTFYDYYPEKDALCWGIGSTTSCTWETLTKEMFKKSLEGENPLNIVPKNIVVNVGTNNVYDIRYTRELTVSSLQRLYTMLHGLYPQAKIYYFNITHRMYEEAEISYPTVNAINADMKAWCGGKDWITFVDISDKIKLEDLRIEDNDYIHPKPEAYRYFVQALEDCGIEILDL